jgi:cyanophycinase
VPALVPPGFTRGPILFMGSSLTEQAEVTLLQRFWTEAGGYGARILIMPAAEQPAAAESYVKRLTDWESAEVKLLTLENRHDAQLAHHQVAIEQATAILILEGNPLRFAGLLGGTPVAQAIRRVNARGKLVAGIGRGAALLCQHMIAFERPSETGTGGQPPPFLYRKLLQFAPGLGIINRLVLDVGHLDMDKRAGASPGAQPLPAGLSRLLTAVAYNPFLVGVGLAPSTGVAVYPDSTLEVFGEGSVLVVDGAGMSYTDMHEYESEAPISMLGVQFHVLGCGYTFNFDQRTAQQPDISDIPIADVPEQSKSPF